MQTDALFTQYLDVVNRALGENRDRFPYNRLFKAGDAILGDKPIGVAIYKDDASTPHDHFEVKFQDGTFRMTSHGKAEASSVWKMPQSHLENVVEHPQTYVSQPAKLDMDWLAKRMGVA